MLFKLQNLMGNFRFYTQIEVFLWTNSEVWSLWLFSWTLENFNSRKREKYFFILELVAILLRNWISSEISLEEDTILSRKMEKVGKLWQTDYLGLWVQTSVLDRKIIAQISKDMFFFYMRILYCFQDEFIPIWFMRKNLYWFDINYNYKTILHYYFLTI